MNKRIPSRGLVFPNVVMNKPYEGIRGRSYEVSVRVYGLIPVLLTYLLLRQKIIIIIKV